MSIEAIVAGAALPAPATLQAGYGAGLSELGAADVEGFRAALASAGAPVGPEPLPAGIQSVLSQLERVNGEASSVATYAKEVTADGNALTPGEVIQLTMRCHEFMFHCQLSSSVANRTSDGLQQLFRQQS
jgi:hypothetical protein